MAVTTTKQMLRDLVNEMTDEQASRLLETLRDPVARALMLAPIDDEPLTPEDEAAIEEGRQARARGEVYSLEEVERELGL